MRSLSPPRGALLGLLVLLAGSWLAPAARALSSAAGHCAPGAEGARSHPAESEAGVPQDGVDSHDCPECDTGCPGLAQCAAGGGAALAAAPAEFDLSASAARPRLWVSDRPLSANPTPPIPPPQPVR